MNFDGSNFIQGYEHVNGGLVDEPSMDGQNPSINPAVHQGITGCVDHKPLTLNPKSQTVDPQALNPTPGGHVLAQSSTPNHTT